MLFSILWLLEEPVFPCQVLLVFGLCLSGARVESVMFSVAIQIKQVWDYHSSHKKRLEEAGSMYMWATLCLIACVCVCSCQWLLLLPVVFSLCKNQPHFISGFSCESYHTLFVTVVAVIAAAAAADFLLLLLRTLLHDYNPPSYSFPLFPFLSSRQLTRIYSVNYIWKKENCMKLFYYQTIEGLFYYNLDLN